MSKDININESAILETLNAKIDYDGGNYKGSGLANYVVDKSGDTMTGSLNIQSTSVGLKYLDNNFDLTVVPETAKYSAFMIGDKYGTRLGQLECSQTTDGARTTGINTMFTASDGSFKFCSIITGFDANGNAYTATTTPSASDNSTKIATTAFVKSVLSSSGNGLATIKKSANGYIKFNNGIIIQWGEISVGGNGTAVQTLPTAFTNANYQCSATCNVVSTGDDQNVSIGEKTTTTMKVCNGIGSTRTVMWIAIGY